MVVQAGGKSQKYTGVFNALRTILAEEYPGRPLRIFAAPLSLIPALLYFTLEAVMLTGSPVLIDRVLLVSKIDHPLQYALWQLASQIIQLCLLTPLDTVRRRLHVQIKPRAPQKSEYRSLVALNSIPYTGVWDCMYRICCEEGSGRFGGISALYRGFMPRLYACVGVALIQLASAK